MFEKTIDYARESLIVAIDKAGDKLGEVVDGASREIDDKLDKISQELHSQRSLTKDDVRELVDYAADRLSVVLDDRIAVMRREISELAKEKTEYFKAEIDAFFVHRQEDLSRERRRLLMNIVLAMSAAIGVGAVSLFYKGLAHWDMLTVFRVVMASLAGGYSVWLILSLLRNWLRLAEHRKDMFYLAARYWGWLRPASVFTTLLVLVLMVALSLALAFPHEAMKIFGMPIFKVGP